MLGNAWTWNQTGLCWLTIYPCMTSPVTQISKPQFFLLENGGKNACACVERIRTNAFRELNIVLMCSEYPTNVVAFSCSSIFFLILPLLFLFFLFLFLPIPSLHPSPSPSMPLCSLLCHPSIFSQDSRMSLQLTVTKEMPPQGTQVPEAALVCPAGICWSKLAVLGWNQ